MTNVSAISGSKYSTNDFDSEDSYATPPPTGLRPGRRTSRTSSKGSVERPSERGMDIFTVKGVERPVDKGIDMFTVKGVERHSDRSAERNGQRGGERPTNDKRGGQTGDAPNVKGGQKPPAGAGYDIFTASYNSASQSVGINGLKAPPNSRDGNAQKDIELQDMEVVPQKPVIHRPKKTQETRLDREYRQDNREHTRGKVEDRPKVKKRRKRRKLPDFVDSSDSDDHITRARRTSTPKEFHTDIESFIEEKMSRNNSMNRDYSRENSVTRDYVDRDHSRDHSVARDTMNRDHSRDNSSVRDNMNRDHRNRSHNRDYGRDPFINRDVSRDNFVNRDMNRDHHRDHFVSRDVNRDHTVVNVLKIEPKSDEEEVFDSEDSNMTTPSQRPISTGTFIVENVENGEEIDSDDSRMLTPELHRPDQRHGPLGSSQTTSPVDQGKLPPLYTFNSGPRVPATVFSQGIHHIRSPGRYLDSPSKKLSPSNPVWSRFLLDNVSLASQPPSRNLSPVAPEPDYEMSCNNAAAQCHRSSPMYEKTSPIEYVDTESDISQQDRPRAPEHGYYSRAPQHAYSNDGYEQEHSPGRSLHGMYYS